MSFPIDLQLIRDVPEVQKSVDSYLTRVTAYKARQGEVSQRARAELASRRAAADVTLSGLNIAVARAQEDNRSDGSPNDHATTVLSEAAG